MTTPTPKTLIETRRGRRFAESPRWHDGKLDTVLELPFEPNSFGIRSDGITLDAEGAVWLANPDGESQILRVLDVAVPGAGWP